MKVIELLNKIANGEEVPKKIKYEDDIYILLDNYCYFCEETGEILSQNISAEFSRLNEEVEIIEEDKKIEKLDTDELFICDNHEHIYSNFINVYNKINEIIDKINKE